MDQRVVVIIVILSVLAMAIPIVSLLTMVISSSIRIHVYNVFSSEEKGEALKKVEKLLKIIKEADNTP